MRGKSLGGLIQHEEGRDWAAVAPEVCVQGEVGDHVVADPVLGTTDAVEWQASLRTTDHHVELAEADSDFVCRCRLAEFKRLAQMVMSAAISVRRRSVSAATSSSSTSS